MYSIELAQEKVLPGIQQLAKKILTQREVLKELEKIIQSYINIPGRNPEDQIKAFRDKLLAVPDYGYSEEETISNQKIIINGEPTNLSNLLNELLGALKKDFPKQ